MFPQMINQEKDNLKARKLFDNTCYPHVKHQWKTGIITPQFQ